MDNFKQPLDPWYVTGFSEGECTFTYENKARISPIFAIKLTSSEVNIIDKLQKFFGVGKIYFVKASKPNRSGGFTKTSIYYKVFAIHDLAKIVEHFEKYPLRGEKMKRYVFWTELVYLRLKYYGKAKWPKKDEDRLYELAAQISALSPKNIPWDG